MNPVLRFRRPIQGSRNSKATKGLTKGADSVLPLCLPESTENDPDLALVMAVWPSLPEAVRAGIVAMVRAHNEANERASSGGSTDK